MAREYASFVSTHKLGVEMFEPIISCNSGVKKTNKKWRSILLRKIRNAVSSLTMLGPDCLLREFLVREFWGNSSYFWLTRNEPHDMINGVRREELWFNCWNMSTIGRPNCSLPPRKEGE